MRDGDWREISACLWDDDKDLFFDRFKVALFAAVKWTAFHDDKPVAILAVVPMWPGVWSACMFATDSFPLIGKRLTRALRKSIIPSLAESGGVHRVQCNSIEGYDEVHRWLRSLGAKEETVIPRHGKNRENFVTFSWTP